MVGEIKRLNADLRVQLLPREKAGRLIQWLGACVWAKNLDLNSVSARTELA